MTVPLNWACFKSLEVSVAKLRIVFVLFHRTQTKLILVTAMPPSNSTDAIPSDELLARKYDKCLAKSIVNAGMGLSVGIGLSFLLFKSECQTH